MKQENSKIEAAYENYTPGVTRVTVFTLENNNGHVSKTEWFTGLLTLKTSRGLRLVPLGEYGSSSDNLASSFVPYPEFSAKPIQFRIANPATR